MISIRYGIVNDYVEIKVPMESKLNIPASDHDRVDLLNGGTDPYPMQLKHIWVEFSSPEHRVYLPAGIAATVDLVQQKVIRHGIDVDPLDARFMDRIHTLHARISLRHGSMKDEFPEQCMVARFLTGSETVLELGANVGRNSLFIAALLHDPARLVSVECVAATHVMLQENIQCNNYPFNTVCAAISHVPLEYRGWNTRPLTGDPQWTRVPTMEYSALQQEFPHHVFDTLVVDCEGALLPILQQFPYMLDTIQLILMENDYTTLSDYESMAHILRSASFECVYVEALTHLDHQVMPCRQNFFEAWRKRGQ